MKFVVIGCSSGMPSANTAHSCYLVENAGKMYMFDCGDGAASAMVRQEIDTSSIGNVFISHTHPDHFTGIFMFLQMEHLKKRRSSISIHVPSEIADLFDSMLRGFYLFPEKLWFDIEIVPISGGFEFNEDDLNVRTFQNTHLQGQSEYIGKLGLLNKMQCFSSVIIADHAKIVYSADIGSASDLDKIAEGADLLVTEGMHVDLSGLPGFLVNRRVESCLLTHLPDYLDTNVVKSAFEKEGFPRIYVADEGQTIEVVAKP